ncbi:MAG TPA: galactose oxidase [Planctomycetaceae bacterium]|nr:galactose oxidase [Planctomycetaceae bacterium]
MLMLFALASFAAEPAPNWIRVAEHAAWKPRDSSGELVYNNRLWLFGGWFDSFAPPPRDVWSSADGKTWELVTAEAPWKYSDLGMTAVFQGKMWFLGGWTNGRLAGHGATNECWSSTNGRDWTLESNAAWSPRLAAGVVVFQNKLWMIGGTENYYFGDEKSAKNDVWSSADGKTWTLATANAGWSPRAYHQAVAHDGKLWVMGGGNYVPQYEARNDVWCSTDGVHWQQVVEHAPWSPRLWFSAVTHRDRMWVLGGWSNNPPRNWGDVWHSRDGKAWQQLKTEVTWKERHEHSAYVFQDKIWIAGGHAQPLSNEVWRLDLPRDFAKGE